MDQRKEEWTKRPLYVFDLPQDVLLTLERKNKATSDPAEGPGTLEYSELVETGDVRTSNTGSSKSCSLCGVAFPTVEEQRSHSRSDLHGYNLKQRLRGLDTVSEDDFEKIIGDLNESLSGSDSSDSEDDDEAKGRKGTTLSILLRKQTVLSADTTGKDGEFLTTKRRQGSGNAPIFWFTTPTIPPNTYLGIYRAIFTNREQENENDILNAIRNKQIAPKPPTKANKESKSGIPSPKDYEEPHIFLCMIGGGHFAAMVVSLAPKQTKSAPTGPIMREATVIAHKTFHRYTTRRKQGGAQSANDSAKGAAHSAGSSLRRSMEVALTEEVRSLLSDWKGMIDSAELLFVRATGNTNRKTLFGPYDNQVLRQNDIRMRSFPFSTRRATQNELMRSFVELTRVKVQEVDEARIAIAAAAEESKRQALISKASKSNEVMSVTPKKSEEEEIAELHTTQLLALIRRSKAPALLSYLKANGLSPDYQFYPTGSQQHHHAPTLLHLAASLNYPPLVTSLIVKAGANPEVLNGDGKSAFDLTGDRNTRDAFRVARSILGETAFKWDAAHVPSALALAEVEARMSQEKQEAIQQEDKRRKVEAERLEREGPRVAVDTVLGKAAGRGRALALGHVQKTAQEKREEESRGLTPEMKMKLERERRARAAEERIKRMQSDGG